VFAEPATRTHHPEPDEENQHPHILFFKMHFNIIPIKILYVFVISARRFTCPVHIVLVALITIIMSGEQKNYDTPHYAVGLLAGRSGF
jgi:hypothetical protein